MEYCVDWSFLGGCALTSMNERIKTPFGFRSTVDDVIDGIDLSGKYSIVTGGSSGIGIETASQRQVPT